MCAVFSKEFDNEATDYFDGLKRLKGLIDPPPPPVLRVPPIDTVQKRTTDSTDKKFVSFLKGKKVFLTEKEIEDHIIDF